MFLLFVSTAVVSAALAGTNTHSDGTTTIVRDGCDVVSVTSADGTLDYKAGGSGDILELTGDVEIDGPVLSVGEAIWVDLDEKKALGVAFKDKDRSFAVEIEGITAWYDPLPDPVFVTACEGGGGFGLDGTLWQGDGSYLAVEQDDGVMTIWTVPTEGDPGVSLVGGTVFTSSELAKGGVVTVDVVKGEGDVVISTEAGEETARQPLAFVYHTITWSFFRPEIEDEVVCGALLEFQIPEK